MRSQGKGIEFFEADKDELTFSAPSKGGQPHVVFQRAVPNAMLLDGYRFHARVYVLVPSYAPMRVLLFDEALVFTARLREADHPDDRVR